MPWVDLIVGVLVLLSPWVLGMGQSVITWTNAGLGIILILAGLWRIMLHKASIKEN